MKPKILIDKYLNRLDIHTLEVVKKSSASMVVKVIGMAAGLGISIFLGRTLGAEGLGIINLANRIVGLLLVLAMLGMDQVLVKHIAIAYEKRNWQQVADNIYTSSIINGALALIICIVGILLSPYLSNHIFNEPQLEIPLKIAFIVMLPQTFSRIFGAGLNGFRKIWQSSLVNETLSMWTVGAVLLILYFLKVKIDVVAAAYVYAIGRVTVTIAVWAYWKRIFHFNSKRKWIAKPMLKISLPLLLVSSSALIASNTDTLMLGWLSTAKQVGLYNVGARLALLTSFFLMVSNAAVAPKIASLYAKGKIKELENMIQRITRGLGAIALFPLPIFIFFGKPILSIWGMEFQSSHWILIIITIGQLFNIATGATGQILIMCGREKLLGKIKIIEVVSNLILNYILILQYQALGAAIATTITIATLNIAKVFLVKKKLGISIF